MFSLFNTTPVPLPFDYDLTSPTNDNVSHPIDVYTCNFPFHLELTAPPLAQAISTYPAPAIQQTLRESNESLTLPTADETKATLSMVYRNVSCALRWNIHPVGKSRYGRPVRQKFIEGIPPFTWKRYFWEQGLKDEKKRGGKSGKGLEELHLATLERVGMVLGVEPLARRFSLGERAFIAPRGYATCEWTPKDLQPIDEAMPLSVENNDYLAIIAEADPEHWLCFRPGDYDDDTRSQVLGQDVVGKTGYVPKNIVIIEIPVQLRYSPKTYKIRLTFAYFPFNSRGLLVTTPYHS